VHFIPTKLEGAWIIEPQPHTDDRGFFARTFCEEEFRARGLVERFVQCNMSYNQRRGTIRGLHYQIASASEVKLVRCTAGALLDVIVDLRPTSPTYLQSDSVELAAGNRLALYVPESFAHGFQTLEDSTEVHYQMSAFYAPKLGRGLRYDDPKLGLNWPLSVSSISAQDLSWPFLSEKVQGLPAVLNS
jgi:dTDP-4-dehydrorhamnose 3,5-epimerase